MALLRGRTVDVGLTLRPYSFSEEGRPRWIAIYVELAKGPDSLLSTTVNVTDLDLAALGQELAKLATGISDRFTLTTSDEDLVFDAQRLLSGSDVSVGLWVGEPYGLMKGFKFVTTMAEVEHFQRELESDCRRLGLCDGIV